MEKWSRFLPSLYAFILPIHPHESIYVVIVWGLLAIWNYKQARLANILRPTFWIFTGFFIWHLPAMLYTDYPTLGWKDITSKLMLFLVPLYFFLYPQRSNFREVTTVFSWG